MDPAPTKWSRSRKGSPCSPCVRALALDRRIGTIVDGVTTSTLKAHLYAGVPGRVGRIARLILSHAFCRAHLCGRWGRQHHPLPHHARSCRPVAPN